MSSVINLESIRPLRRNDLEVVCRSEPDEIDRSEWVVKDPIQLNYFFLDQFQHWLFERLDGITSLTQTQKDFEQTFSPAKISDSQLLTFCMRLSRDGLLCENLSGEQLRERELQKKKFNLLRLPASLLSIRLPGVNANAIISVAEHIGSWVFSPLTVALASVWLLFTIIFGVQVFDDIVLALPTMSSIGARDIVLFLVCVSVVKIVHELAHAVCCRRMGATCREIGVMFLVFSPCLYCNVTDSWMLKSKWKRIAISAAGIYVELLIASVSLMLWCYAATPFLRSLFLNLFIICSVSTLLINGNPLMRYDGYFILSDWVGIPNLSQQSKKTAWNFFSRILFIDPQRVEILQNTSTTIFLIGYYLASLVYRILILSFIFFALHSILEPVGLENIAVSAGVIYLLTLFLGFVLSMIPFIQGKNRQAKKNWLGICVALLLIGLVGFFVASIKVPHVVDSQAVIEFEEIALCSAQTSGVLQWAATDGTEVQQGDVVARLSRFDSDLKRTELLGQIEMAKLRIKNLETQSTSDPKTRISIPSAQAELDSLEKQMKMLGLELEQLKIVAPTSGVVIEALRVADTEANPMKLASWDGSLIDPVNQGCTVNEGETVCLVGNLNQWKAHLLIEERKMDLIAIGHPVEIRTSTQRTRTYNGSIKSISSEIVSSDMNSSVQPQSLLAQNQQRYFRAELELDEPIEIGFRGAPAKANIIVAERTLFDISKRFLVESFRFRF
ncbi:HlyD family efflux transporter periplasmic adaptor subunit [bacterium]|nr:HlyD family efflux transporter periplasmic adaptor subunit [bacterium]